MSHYLKESVMLEARVLEEHNGLISEGIPSMEEFYKVLNAEFVDTFMAEFNDPVCLREFIYAMDCLYVMAKEPGFPQDRMLDNEDVSESTGKILKRIGLMTNNKGLIGVSVSAPIGEYIKEFFYYQYPQLLRTIFTRLKTPFVVFTLDGINHQLIYYHNIAMLSNMDSIRLTWTQKEENYAVCLPFYSKRAQ